MYGYIYICVKILQQIYDYLVFPFESCGSFFEFIWKKLNRILDILVDVNKFL